jgi:hypothetical protein
MRPLWVLRSDRPNESLWPQSSRCPGVTLGGEELPCGGTPRLGLIAVLDAAPGLALKCDHCIDVVGGPSLPATRDESEACPPWALRPWRPLGAWSARWPLQPLEPSWPPRPGGTRRPALQDYLQFHWMAGDGVLLAVQTNVGLRVRPPQGQAQVGLGTINPRLHHRRNVHRHIGALIGRKDTRRGRGYRGSRRGGVPRQGLLGLWPSGYHLDVQRTGLGHLMDKETQHGLAHGRVGG